MRQATVNRATAETKIALSLNLDGTGKSEINTGVGFLDHMLTLFARHAGYDLTVVTARVKPQLRTPFCPRCWSVTNLLMPTR